MRIGVISDTHIPQAALKIPEEVINAFKGVDLILHAGDLMEMPVINELGKIAKAEAVCGNMDTPLVQKLLPEKKIINAGNYKIGLVHGSGAPFGMIGKVKNEFPGGVDAIVFGHTHSAVNEVRDGILFFNPGSPTDKIFAKFNSFGIITINKGIRGRIIKL